MRIVISTAVYYPQINGVAVFSYNLAKGLAKRGHKVLVVCPSQIGKNYVKNEGGVEIHYLRSVQAKIYPDQIHDVPKKRFQLFYKHGFRVSVFPQIEVVKILNEFQPDIVHVQVSDPIGLSVVSYAKKHKIPIVTTEHNQPEVLTDSLKMPRMFKKGANILLSSYFRNRQSKSDFVTMPTEQAIRNLLKNGRDLGVSIAAVSNGVDLTNFKPGRARDEIYKKYHIVKEEPVVLYVGRLDPEKRVETVIKAFLKMEMLDAQLVIVGDGVDKARLEQKYGEDRRIRFLGRVLSPDLYDLYKIGWVFVTASGVETQGIVLIEAAACGLPLIAMDAGAVSEVCQDGKNGKLCKSDKIDEMAIAMVEILSDEELRRKYSKKSLEIATGHDFEKTLDSFENIYDKVLRR